MQTPVRLAGRKEQADDPLGLLVWIPLRIAVRAPDLPHGRMMEPCTAPGLVAPPFQQTALHEGECRCAPQTTPPSQEAIVGVGRILEAIGGGEQRPKDRTELEPWMPVLVRARQATHLQPQDQPSMVSTDLSQ